MLQIRGVASSQLNYQTMNYQTCEKFTSTTMTSLCVTPLMPANQICSLSANEAWASQYKNEINYQQDAGKNSTSCELSIEDSQQINEFNTVNFTLYIWDIFSLILYLLTLVILQLDSNQAFTTFYWRLARSMSYADCFRSFLTFCWKTVDWFSPAKMPLLCAN